MQKYNTQQLVERLKTYGMDLKYRMKNVKPVTVDLGLTNGLHGTVEFDIDEVIANDHLEYGKDYYRFEVRFNFTSNQHDDATNMVLISLDTHELRVELSLDSHLNGGNMDDMDNVPLIVSYGEQGGKMITLRPGQSDAPGMFEEEVLLAESLFNEVTTRLGMIPETPFDFTSIRTYVRRCAEVHDQIASLREDLLYERHDVHVAWDCNLSY